MQANFYAYSYVSSLVSNRIHKHNQQLKRSIIMDFEYQEKREDTQFSSSGKTGKIGRIALSKNICRFELPMDMRLLESLINKFVY